jgi:hypothetical protein
MQFEGSRLKITRGRQHASELHQKITVYLQGDPWAVLLERYQNSGQYRVALKGRKAIPAEFSTVFGDAVHNFRTALDILANDLVALSGVQPKKVYFPFGADVAGFENELKAKMGQAPDDIKAIVRSFKPYKDGGNEVLRAMHDLDISDKHIAIMGVAAQGVTGALPMRQTGSRPLPQGGGELTFITDLGALPTVPIDVEGFPVDDPNIETIGKVVGSELSFSIKRELPLAGTPVVSALKCIGDLAENIVKTFEAYCFGEQ